MVENHSPEFIDKDEAQKIDFFEGDVHLGHYDILIWHFITCAILLLS